jgi:hypothetical protein
MGPGRSQLIVVSVIALAVCSLLAAGCGAASPRVVSIASTTTAVKAAATTTTVGSSSGGELGEYASCMRSHGVFSFPDPASFGSPTAIKAAKGQMAQISERGTSSGTFLAAQRTCAKYYGPPATSPPHPSPEEMQKLLAVSRCVRAHGILNFPDPNPSTGELTAPAGISRSSPAVLAALQACRSLGQAAGLGAPHAGA